MSSSPPSDFDLLILDFIASYARTIFTGDDEQPLVVRVYSNFPSKEGLLPASKSAIDALPTVTVTEEEDCAICLMAYDEAKELPCHHRFHSDCIIKWLGIHGSCPVCRYEMPVDEKEDGVVLEVMITVMNRNTGRVDLDSEEDNGSSIEDVVIDMGVNGNQDSLDDLD